MQEQTSPPEHHDGLSGWLSYLAAHGSSMDPKVRLRVYVLTLTFALVVIWMPVLAFVLLSEVTYTSKFSLIMPVTGAGQSVNLESIGQATASTSSPFSQSSVDPKVNYQAIAMSKPVLKAAAAAVDLEESEFGKPRIKLVDLTALMNFELKGSTAQQAHDKSWALFNAIQARLEQLRKDEVSERERYTNATLEAFSEKLGDAQQRIVEFQKQSRIISLEQFRYITLGMEDNRRKIAAMRAQLGNVKARIASLQEALGIDGPQSARLLTLQQDAQFQQVLERHATAAANLAEHRARFGDNNFKVRDALQVERGLYSQLQSRARALGVELDVEFPVLEAFGRTAQSADSMVQALAGLTVEASGLSAELAAVEAQLAQDEGRLAEGIGEATTLEDLDRKRQVALAVFTTALAKVDLGRSDNFSSYPMLQILSPPTKPYKADTLGRVLALVGGILGSFFSATGLLVLWFRKPFIQKILKSG